MTARSAVRRRSFNGKAKPHYTIEVRVDPFSDFLEEFAIPRRPVTRAQAVMEAAAFDEPAVSIEERAPLIAAVRDAMDNLSDDQRMLLDALLFERRSYRYLAQQWCIPKSTLHRWYSSAIDQLRKELVQNPEIINYLEGTA